MNTADRARLLAWAIASLSLVLILTGLGVSLAARAQDADQPSLPQHLLFSPVSVVAYALIGVLVASRHPRNPIGWIFGVVAVFFGLILLSSSYDVAAGSDRLALPGVGILSWLGLWVWIPATILPLTFLLLLFPDGRLPSARWRPIAWSAGLGLVGFMVSTALHPLPPIEPNPPDNPAGVPGATGMLDLLGGVAGVLLAVGVFGALAALVARFRRTVGREREQVKWLAYAGVVAIVQLCAVNAWSATRPADPVAYEIAIMSVWVALTLIGLGTGVAILRHRLYDIDLIINRTLVYGALSVGVVGMYVLIVGALGAVFQSSGNLVIALLATGLAAILFQPLRARLQRAVDRLMYGDRDDPYAVLSHLGQQIKASLAPSAVLPGIAEGIAQALRLPYVALALEQGGGLEIAAAYGRPNVDPVRLPLVYQTETVGQLLVAPRASGESFTPAERRLLEDIALQVGVAAHAVRLADDLQRSRERLVTAREEERRRLRRDLHDGLGPQLASLTLTLAAARELLRHDVDAADRLLQELAIHTQSATADVRRVVYDLRPPALDDLGLVLAVREQADRYRKAGLEITIDAPDQLPSLPAAVEVAAYRIVQEALTNVVRHAQARTCLVRVTLRDALEVEVRDDGIGLAPGSRAGVGLTSIRERTAELGGTLTIGPAPGRGTSVQVKLPLRQEGT